MAKILRIFIMLMCLSLMCLFTVSAHTTSQSGVLETYYISAYGRTGIGGEDVGWSIDELIHIGTTTFSYKFTSDPSVIVSAEVKTAVRNAASCWSSVATITESSSALGTIMSSEDHEDGVAARFTPISAYESTGHLAEWTIDINDAYSIDPATIAHEFGHVIGLNDLYANYSANKLMYYSTASTATAPTSADLWGAKVILGIHTTHSFDEYRYWGKDTDGNHYHVQYCSDCNGNRATRARCAFSLSDPMKRCITCGYSTYLAP